MRSMRVVGVIALGLTLSAAATAASGGRPVLRVTDRAPFTVHGWRFKADEHLRVVITVKHRTTKTLDASGRGTFTLELPRLSVPRCGQYSVRAYGPSGLRASVKTPPYSCGAPPQPER
jgi:hypothetical protein